MSAARDAVKALKNIGYGNAHLDMAEGIREEYSVEINPAGTEEGGSLSSLILNSRDHLTDIDRAPLLAASPMVSGMGSYSEITGSEAHMFVTVEKEKVNEVKKIITQMGGMV